MSTEWDNQNKKAIDLEGSKLIIATPFYDQTCNLMFTLSFAKTVEALHKKGVQVYLSYIGGCCYIDKSRNVLVSMFIRDCEKYDLTHFMFVDGDQMWEPEAVLDLMACATHEPMGVYTAPYCTKEEKTRFHYPPTNPANPVISAQGYLEVDHAATGFMMMHKDLVQNLYARKADEEYTDITVEGVEKARPLFMCQLHTHEDGEVGYMGEDVTFCRWVRSLGIPIWTSLHHTIGHVDGKNVYNRDYKDYLKNVYGILLYTEFKES